MQEVSITTEGIQKNLKNFKPLDALCEYIWNGFDAQADRVDVKLHTNEFGLINMISIVDKEPQGYKEQTYIFISDSQTPRQEKTEFTTDVA